MKHKEGDVVRVISSRGKNGMVTMIEPYVGTEAIVEYVDEERELYRIRMIMPKQRGAIRFNVIERMVEEEVTPAMMAAGLEVFKDEPAPSDDTLKKVYQAMHAARWGERK